jgi:23S rRNA (cytosine1962-C5)-methyltransferase
MEINGEIILKSGREASIERYHPWIFSGGIKSKNGNLKDGDWVSISNNDGKILGFGHFQNGSIAIRILSFGSNPPDSFLYQNKIQRAFQLRNGIGLISPKTNCYRLVHGEADGLPGLIVDIYNNVAVVQSHSDGMHNDRVLISEAIKKELHISSVYYKSQNGNESGYLMGSALTPHEVFENGNQFFVDWQHGQKTGFFLDQRENRKLLGEFCRGRKVLNTFCYTGGFSVYAAKSGASLVHSVDASEKAIELCKQNLTLNGIDTDLNQCLATDTFDYFKSSEEKYDLIVLDPPAFAKHREAKHQAMKGYQRLNAEAIKRINSGGIIFTFSCSQVVDRKLFYDTIMSSAIQAGRDVKVLTHLSQPADHPVSAFHPEGEYLKGLVLYVA